MLKALLEVTDNSDTDRVIDRSLRQLYLVAADPDKAFEDKANELLAIGLDCLGLSLGIVSRVEAGRYMVVHSEGPGAPDPGTIFDLAQTYCCHTLAAEDVESFHHAGRSRIATHPCYQSFGLESYIGTPLVVRGKVLGTLNFSAAEARRQPFSEKEHELVRFFGRWISKEWERAEDARELEKKTALLEAIFDAMPGSLIVADLNRRITMTNETMTEMFGYSAEDLEGRQTSVLYSDFEQFRETGATRYNPAASGALDAYEMSYRRRNGEDFIGETNATRLKTRAGVPLGYLAVIRDITRRKRVERQRDHAISVVSHELRTPVSLIAGSLQLLGRFSAALPERGRELLEVSGRNAERLGRLIDDILDSGRLQSGQSAMDFAELDLGHLLRQSAEDARHFAEEHGVGVAVSDTPEAPVLVRGHASRIQQVIDNLTTNAIKASPKGASVELGLLTEGGFWVRDAGPGIPEKLQPVLFERFTRSDAESFRFGGGTGLGLSIVKAILDQHDAEIDFATAEGQGTTFRVRFPG
ncbi:ATP-binding protein [Roseivivax sp.]